MKTDLTVILDRSGSMSSSATEAIGGFNSMVEDQKKIPGECVLSLCHFDSEYNASDMPSYIAKPLSEVAPLTTETFIPRGWTALRDALGRTITAIGVRLAAMPEAYRPEKVIVMIITDGQENSSKEFTAAKIKEMIEHQRTAYKWEFIFVGANMDAVTTGQSYGFLGTSSITYDPASTGAVYRSVSNFVSSSRTGVVDTSFTSADRDASVGKVSNTNTV